MKPEGHKYEWEVRYETLEDRVVNNEKLIERITGILESHSYLLNKTADILGKLVGEEGKVKEEGE